MISGILFIILAWVLNMPLWASILLTIYGSFKIMWGMLKIAAAVERNL